MPMGNCGHTCIHLGVNTIGVRETQEQALERWKKLELLQKHYARFEDLLVDVIEDVMGFKCTDIQQDIGHYVAYGPKYRMVQAQRGEAKTTITAIYAVYSFIHNPTTRVLIISAGEDQATEIANWVIQIINNMDELECLRPDRTCGDRSSVEAFDIHYTLKGPEKSPSLACIGITANMQGKRADLLIADDIESQKNSQTATQRERIKLLTKDFTSICSTGDIVYLGTPQSIDSIYNDLPNRGYDVRIWPGRYPTNAELPQYTGFLAPIIQKRIERDPSLQSGGGPMGDRGKPVDPVLLNEEALARKEIDQGASYFQLQHMLSTKLSDAERFPLKASLLRVLAFDREDKRAPMTLNFMRTDENRIQLPAQFPVRDSLYRVRDGSDYAAITGWHMYVDPAGGGANGDELAYAVTGFLAGRVHVAAVGGMPGGIDIPQLNWLTTVAKRWKVQTIDIEKNFGNGALASVWTPLLLKEHQCGIEEVWESGQKELRIIDVLEPVIGSGKLVMHEDVIREDWEQCQRYGMELRGTYSLFWQLARITRDRGSLIHDDRLDALAGSVRKWVENLAIDEAKVKAAAKQEAYNRMLKNPLGDGRPLPGRLGRVQASPNIITRALKGRY